MSVAASSVFPKRIFTFKLNVKQIRKKQANRGVVLLYEFGTYIAINQKAFMLCNAETQFNQKETQNG